MNKFVSVAPDTLNYIKKFNLALTSKQVRVNAATVSEFWQRLDANSR